MLRAHTDPPEPTLPPAPAPTLPPGAPPIGDPIQPPPAPAPSSGSMLDLLAAVTAECEALLARGPLPDGLGHGDAFERLLQLLRECVPTDPARR